MAADEAGPLREEEQRRSAAVVGFATVEFLGPPAGVVDGLASVPVDGGRDRRGRLRAEDEQPRTPREGSGVRLGVVPLPFHRGSASRCCVSTHSPC